MLISTSVKSVTSQKFGSQLAEPQKANILTEWLPNRMWVIFHVFWLANTIEFNLWGKKETASVFEPLSVACLENIFQKGLTFSHTLTWRWRTWGKKSLSISKMFLKFNIHMQTKEFNIDIFNQKYIHTYYYKVSRKNKRIVFKLEIPSHLSMHHVKANKERNPLQKKEKILKMLCFYTCKGGMSCNDYKASEFEC